MRLVFPTWLEVLEMDDADGVQDTAALGAAGTIGFRHYDQDLHRSIGILGNLHQRSDPGMAR